MDITRKRIINPQRYLYALHPGDKFYIAVPLAEEDYPRLQFYGLLPDPTEGCNDPERQRQMEGPQRSAERETVL